VHIFAKQGETWSSVARLSSSGVQKNERFGAPIVVDGARVYVGVPGFANSSGTVFVFGPDAQGELRETGRINAYDARTAEQFGSAIAASGYNIWVGAPRAQGSRGAVYHIWRPTGDTLSSQADRLMSAKPSGGAVFGFAVAATSNLAVIGSGNADFGLGAVEIYELANGMWTPTITLTRPDERIASVTGKKVECNNGKAAHFECSNVELMSYLSVPEIGGGRGIQVSGIWGWTDPETGKEWALVGRLDGTSFVDVSNPERPRYVGDLPVTKGANPAIWREIKVYKNHAYIVSDGAGPHGMQVFDLTRLRNVKQPPVTFDADVLYRNINSAHNIVINEETGFAYSTGGSSGGETCGGGLHMMDIRDPKKPTFVGCFADPQTGRSSTGYTHDAQCVVYRGPDEQYRGREICLGSNETMLSIADVTDKKNPKAISRMSYPNVGYTHQGWLTEDQRFFYMNDELDELSGSTPKTRTIIWDLSDLDDPQVAGTFLSPTSATDHNLYIKGDTMYQSHYVAGVRVVDISNRKNPVEIGFFDTVPYGGNTPGFGGSWSNYPFFKSGIIIATSSHEGLFVLKKKKAPAKPVL
jgi:choice-of-anchor B domain-containing protein